MRNISPILTLACLVEFTLVLNVNAARRNHHPWFAPRTETEFTAQASTRHTTLDAFAASELRSNRSVKGERIVEQANRYRGTRYRFGGDSKSKGFDCSGLVRRVYNDLNMKSVPRTSGALYKMGKPVHMNELLPGDLVFFKNTYKSGISHVGVYEGDNHFIHAQNRRHGVTRTSLADPYFQLHYAGARRLY